jgi:Uma2 family endonuclease
MTTTVVKLITAEELLLMPRVDGRRFELIRGVLIEKMPTGDPHGESVVLFTLAVGNYARSNRHGVVRAGEPGYWLERDPDTVRAPDVAWFAPGRLPRGTRGYPEIAPDLAVEVKSPGNSWPEMTSKAYMWLCYGSQQVWLGDPETVSVRIYRPNAAPVILGRDDVLDGGELLPEFSVPVRDLFLWEE